MKKRFLPDGFASNRNKIKCGNNLVGILEGDAETLMDDCRWFAVSPPYPFAKHLFIIHL
jgi:hypothetical protein